MKKLKTFIKATPVFWEAKKRTAILKYSQALNALCSVKELGNCSNEQNKTIMIFSTMGIFADHLIVDTLLGRELMRHGVSVIVVLCDSQLPACHVTDTYSLRLTIGKRRRALRQNRLCKACVESTKDLQLRSGLSYATFSDGIEHARKRSMSKIDLDMADEINSGIIRFAASSHPKVLEGVPNDICDKYVAASVISAEAITGLFEKYHPDVVIAHHGIYIPQGVVQKVAKHHNVSFYSWHFGYRKSTLIFSRGDTYHRELTGPLDDAFRKPLTAEQTSLISRYLESRVTGGQDWIHFNRSPKSINMEGSKRRYFVCYTSVDWDAALHFPASVFSSQFEFLDKLIEIFRTTVGFDLVIRVHPAEVTGFHPAALSIHSYLNSQKLPENVKVIGPSDKTSSYDLAKNCTASIVYNTKLGIELPTAGIPVIVAGDCWIRNKGFSYDVNSSEDLKDFIRQGTSLNVTAEQRTRAVQFAYYFYFRRCIDTPELINRSAKFHIEVSSDGIEHSRENCSGLSFVAQQIISSLDVVKTH